MGLNTKHNTMDTYTGTKTVKATPMTLGDYNVLREWKIPENENPDAPGYLVEYQDGGKANHPMFKGYISWSPADVFEKSYWPSGTPFERVAEEKRQLDVNIGKLGTFIESHGFEKLDEVNQNWLLEQHNTQRRLSHILGERLKIMS